MPLKNMPLKNTQDRWGSVSQGFHWLIVVLILGLGIVGLTMGELPKTPKYFWVYTLHKSFGITVLVLMVLRLGWRLYAGAAAAVAGTPGWQQAIASGTHWLLYALALAMPLVGWLSNTGLLGPTNGEISDRYPTLIVAAGYAFAIWGPIFLLDVVFGIAQARVRRP